MSDSPFDPTFEELPGVLPIFPLTGVLLLPRAELPLNVFEPRYIAMIDSALAGARMLGMIQPSLEVGGLEMGAAPVFPLGCAGRIVSFAETDDGRYLVTLRGLLRFSIAGELALERGFRRVRPDYSAFRSDLESDEVLEDFFDRERLLAALKDYFSVKQITADWEAIQQAPGERLVTSLCMACPFQPLEKQALLQAPDLSTRAETLIKLLELDASSARPASGGARH
jgi:Lon protease-like protein